jgi:Skp family chaperone for outer membrane proteins
MSFGYRTGAAIAACALMISGASAVAAPGPALGGSAVPGVCFISWPEVLDASKAGKAATARLQQLGRDNGGGLETERQGIEAEAKAIESGKAGMSAAQLQQRQQALRQRVEAFQVKAERLQRQLALTKNKAVNEIVQQAQPLVAQPYAAHSCGLLLQKESVVGGNLSNDLTPAVLTALDAKMPSMTFDLQPLPAATSGGAAPAQ